MPDKPGPEQKKLIATLSTDPKLAFGGTATRLTSTDPVFLKHARGRLDVYRDLERDAKVFACLQKRYDMTVTAPFQVRPGRRRGASEMARDRKAADMVEAQFAAMGVSFEDQVASAHAQFDMSFNGMLFGLLDAILMGYAVAEVVWDADGREVFVKEVRIRDQRRFFFNRRHELRMVTRSNIQDGVALPDRKFLAFTFGSFWDPYGLSVAHRIFWPVRFKRKDISFWLRFVDKFSGGTVLGKYHEGADETGENSQETLLDACAAVQSEGAVVIPMDMELELLQHIATAAQQGFDQLAKYLDALISQALLGVTLTTDITGVGSKSATESHRVEQREKGRKDGLFLMNFLRATLVQWIVRFNMPHDTATPQPLKLFPDIDKLKDQANIDNTLNQMGWRRKLDSVNETYANGEEVYEPAPRPANPPAENPQQSIERSEAQEE